MFVAIALDSEDRYVLIWINWSPKGLGVKTKTGGIRRSGDQQDDGRKVASPLDIRLPPTQWLQLTSPWKTDHAMRKWVFACLTLPAVAVASGWAIWYFQPNRRGPVEISLDKPLQPLPAALKEGFAPLDPQMALQINNSIAASTAAIEPSRPFSVQLLAVDAISQRSALDCMTAAVYYEAASESNKGQRAVAQVVLNRVRHPAFPKSVCGVVFQGSERRTGCQFSFTCDGNLARRPSQTGWSRARLVALSALSGFVEPSVGTATHYHANYVVPYWAYSLDKVSTVGAHIFYRWKGYWGRRSSFTGIYAGEAAKDLPIPGNPTIFVQPQSFEQLVPSVPTSEAMPTGPRPLADDFERLPVNAPSGAVSDVRPRADLEAGKLLIDETAPKPLAEERPKE